MTHGRESAFFGGERSFLDIIVWECDACSLHSFLESPRDKLKTKVTIAKNDEEKTEII